MRLATGYSNDLLVRVIQVFEVGADSGKAVCNRGFDRVPRGDAAAEIGGFEAKSNKGQSRSPLKEHEE